MLLKNNQSHRFTAASTTTRNIHLINLTTAEHGEAHVIWMKRNISGEWKQENQFPHEVGSAPTSRLWNSDWKERDGVRIWYQTNIQSDRVNLLFTLLFWIKYLLCCSSFSSSGLSGSRGEKRHNQPDRRSHIWVHRLVLKIYSAIRHGEGREVFYLNLIMSRDGDEDWNTTWIEDVRRKRNLQRLQQPDIQTLTHIKVFTGVGESDCMWGNYWKAFCGSGRSCM